MAQASEQDRSRSDRVEVRIYGINTKVSAVAAVASVSLLAFAAGAAVPIVLGATSFAHSTLNTVLISAATLCLGLGIASIAFQRKRLAENRAIFAQAESLHRRADALVRDYDAFMTRSHTTVRER